MYQKGDGDSHGRLLMAWPSSVETVFKGEKILQITCDVCVSIIPLFISRAVSVSRSILRVMRFEVNAPKVHYLTWESEKPHLNV